MTQQTPEEIAGSLTAGERRYVSQGPYAIDSKRARKRIENSLIHKGLAYSETGELTPSGLAVRDAIERGE